MADLRRIKQIIQSRYPDVDCYGEVIECGNEHRLDDVERMLRNMDVKFERNLSRGAGDFSLQILDSEGSMKDGLSTFQNAISILESDGFELGVDFSYFDGVLKFTSRAGCDRAAGLLPTKDIKARGFDYIYLNDSAVVTDAYNKYANETDLSYLKEALKEMRRYESNWSFMTSKEKRNIAPEGGLSELRTSIKNCEDRIRVLEKKDSAIADGVIVAGEGRSMDGIPFGVYVQGGKRYRGFEITSSEDGLRKGFYRFYNWGSSGIPFGNSATDGQFSTSDFERLISEGKIKLLDAVSVSDAAIAAGSNVKVPLKGGSTAVATVLSVSGGMATVRLEEGEHKGLEMDVATSILKDKAIIYAPIVDAATDYVINWNDTYHGTHEKTTVKAKSIKEALEKFKVMVALGGVGWANVYVVNVSPNDGYVRNYGKLNELIKTVSDSATVSELDLDNLPSEDGEQKVKLHTGGKVIEVEVESEEHEREERLGDSAFADAVDLRKLADLINKATDKAEGNTISKSGVYATAEKDHISVSCANSNDVSQVARIVKGLIAVNSEANKTLSVSTSSHEVYVELKDSRKAFTVKDSKGRELLVLARDSDEAVKKVRALRDAAYTVTARTNDFPYGNNLATIVDANSEQEAVAKYRKVLEARGDKINSISARPTTDTDKVKGISRLRDSDLMDGHETELKLLAPLGTLVQKWKAWKNKYRVLAELEDKYWRSWDGYRTSLARNEPEKYKRLTENLKKANSEIQPIINEWNRIAESVDRGIFGGNGKIPKLRPETFPESHLFYFNLEELLENVKRRINYQDK